jgi:hypothetical protein
MSLSCRRLASGQGGVYDQDETGPSWSSGLNPRRARSINIEYKQKVLTNRRGGIRGIVELEILRHIEEYINRNAPTGIDIQRFFDLVVGTRSVAS